MVRRAKTSSTAGLARSWICELATLLRREIQLQTVTPTVAFYSVSTLGTYKPTFNSVGLCYPELQKVQDNVGWSTGGLSISPGQSKVGNPSYR
ncbi:hypothetical protein H4I96_08903 [Botrytis cinerea]